jgi:hypothetical protein
MIGFIGTSLQLQLIVTAHIWAPSRCRMENLCEESLTALYEVCLKNELFEDSPRLLIQANSYPWKSIVTKTCLSKRSLLSNRSSIVDCITSGICLPSNGVFWLHSLMLWTNPSQYERLTFSTIQNNRHSYGSMYFNLYFFFFDIKEEVKSFWTNGNKHSLPAFNLLLNSIPRSYDYLPQLHICYKKFHVIFLLYYL